MRNENQQGKIMNSRENVKIRRIKANVNGKIIEFDEYYKIDPTIGEEVFDKKQMNLLTSDEIKNN